VSGQHAGISCQPLTLDGQDNPLPNVPLFDRYFLGGVTSLRGFRYRQVGK